MRRGAAIAGLAASACHDLVVAFAIDRRLVVLAKRACRVASDLPRAAMLDHIQLVMACSPTQALQHLHDREGAGLVLPRGTSTSPVVYPTHLLDTGTLRQHGVDVQHWLGLG